MSRLEVPTTKASLRALILESLERGYTSASSKDNIQTGNHYQSVTLGEERTKGFRSDRGPFLDHIDFHGKRVLDLGANLGEISRAARSRGAALVDGFEYDPFFVELAQMINAYNDTTRVSFFVRDVTQKATYAEHYDVVLAFSVFEYLQNILDVIAQITDGVLLIETHRLHGNIESTYLDPIGRHFAHHTILGASDWGRGHDADGQRAVVVFAKKEEVLRAHLAGLGAARRHFSAHRRPGSEMDIRAVDVRRTPWLDGFFKKYPGPASETIAAVARATVDVEALARAGEFAKDLGGWAYWLVYLKGALQHADSTRTEAGDPYRDMLTRHWRNDPGRAADVSDAKRLDRLLERRFRDFVVFSGNADAPRHVDPIRIVVTNGPPATSPTRSVKRIYQVGSEIPVETTTVDGYHRLFLARLFGHEEFPCDFVAEDDAVPEAHP